jgi:predicted TIM-barrel fold metal-dependent hydrolase
MPMPQLPHLFSANAHFIEPAHTYRQRMPAKWRAQAPRIVDLGAGQAWVFEGQTRPLLRSSAAVGIPSDQWGTAQLVRYEDMRAGCYDPKARLADMDTDGVYAAACYSSYSGIGFGGDLFFWARDLELGHAAMRAWNDWVHEEWVAADPKRFVAVGCTSYRDPQVAAKEVERNALRGFRGVMFRNPTDLDLPWVRDEHWTPFFRACEETGTVVVHHVAGIEHWPKLPTLPAGEHVPHGMHTVLFQCSVIEMLNSWLWGGVPVRFPKLRVTIAESGGSWLPHLIRRLEWAMDFSPLHRRGWPDPHRRPLELIKAGFTFSTLEVDVALELMERFEIGGWMLEDDYPHCESVWPDSRSYFGKALASVPEATIEDLAWRNAANLFRFPVPELPRSSLAKAL